MYKFSIINKKLYCDNCNKSVIVKKKREVVNSLYAEEPYIVEKAICAECGQEIKPF